LELNAPFIFFKFEMAVFLQFPPNCYVDFSTAADSGGDSNRPNREKNLIFGLSVAGEV